MYMVCALEGPSGAGASLRTSTGNGCGLGLGGAMGGARKGDDPFLGPGAAAAPSLTFPSFLLLPACCCAPCLALAGASRVICPLLRSCARASKLLHGGCCCKRSNQTQGCVLATTL